MLMKKLFTLLAMIFCVGVVHAQRITFDQYDDKGFPMLLESYSAGDFKLTYVDTAGKFAPDADNKSDKVYSANFGTAESFEKFTGRLKPGSKSSEKNNITLTIPSDGTLKVYARSASSSATDRNLVLTQDGTELFNEVIKDADAVKVYLNPEEPDKATSIYGVVSVEVKAGTVNVTYPTGSINFYGFEFEAAGSSAPTEYTVNITSDPENNYFSGYEAFAPADIASALGLSVEEMIELINAKNAEGKVVGGNVYIQLADGTTSNVYTGNANEFWMGKDGQPQGYGDEGTCWYVGLSYDAGGTDEATGESLDPEVDVAVGQMPDFFRKVYTDSDLSTTIYLMNGDKSVKFNVNLHVNAAPEPTLPAPVTQLSKLEIVKDYTLTLPFLLGKQYEGKPYTATLDGVYEALGTDAASFDATAADYIFTQVVESTVVNDETTYTPSDELKTPDSASGGAWFGRYSNFDESTGQETVLDKSYPRAWGDGCTFYCQNITLTEGELSIISGQYPGTLKIGDTDYTYLYIIVGDKAARVKVQVEVTEPQVSDDFVQVGETTVEIEAPVDDSYATKKFSVDIAAIAEALECEPADFDDIYAWASEGVMDNSHTEGSGGFYYNEQGFIQNWGSDAAFFISLGSYTDGQYNIGQMQNHFTNITEPQTVKADFIYRNDANGKYYVIHIVYTVKPAEAVQDDPDDAFDIVSKEALDMELVPSANYYGDEDAETQEKMKLDLDIESIKRALGEGTYEFYGLRAPKTAEEQPSLTTGGGYTPNSGFSSGFWMAKPNAELGDEYIVTSFVGSWGNNAYGIEWNLDTGILGFDHNPDSGNQVGDTYKSTFYIVNTANNKAIKYTLTVTYVEEYSAKVEQVGSTDVAITIADDNVNSDGYYVSAADFDWAPVYEALGITADEIEDCQWMVQNSTGKLITFNSAFEDENAQFDALGLLVDETTGGNLDDVVYAAGFNYDAKQFTVSVLGDIAADQLIKSKVALKSPKGYYVFNLNIGSAEAIASGITSISADSMNDGKIYDLSGRRMTVPTKGLYIMNGKKVYVK